MAWIRKATLAVSGMAMAVGALGATAAPVAAVGGCPAGKLCLYDFINYQGSRSDFDEHQGLLHPVGESELHG
ncbi:peptidase inhibitor family I36 protein [Streptomyces sp. NPDC058378]|uniref:peptidase inhibitor family I36 protein n=1 Tax=Streptomyces sp. NPDC058378 TaxID=3346469 RepID=UPI00364D2A3D